MPILAFGTFRLDTCALELRRDGRKVPIRPQPLGESAAAPRHIESLSRRGYRFIADGISIETWEEEYRKPVASAFLTPVALAEGVRRKIDIEYCLR